MRTLLLTSMLFVSFSCIAVAENTNGQPITITADQSLEWYRNDLFFKAVKNVNVTQGETTLISNTLIAKYREGNSKNIDIYNIEAKGSVKIISRNTKAYGDKAIYNVDKGYAVMTGKTLRLVSDNQTVTAQDKFQYWIDKGRLEALGNATAVREGDTLVADKLVAIFIKNANGKQVLDQLEAIGNVVITTPDEVLKGKNAVYRAQTNIAELTDNVTITRGPNILKGAKAQVNLKTNISKIFGSSDGKAAGRVKGVFFPGAEKKP